MNSPFRWRPDEEGHLVGLCMRKALYSDMGRSDHDHCVFCFVTFGQGEDEVNEGYCTEDGNIWICKECLSEYKHSFELKIADE